MNSKINYHIDLLQFYAIYNSLINSIYYAFRSIIYLSYQDNTFIVVAFAHPSRPLNKL